MRILYQRASKRYLQRSVAAGMSTPGIAAHRALWSGVATAVAAAIILPATGGNHIAAAASLGLNLVAIACLLAAVSLALTDRATGFAINGLNRYSLSRLQMGVWTAVVLGLLLSAAEWNLLVSGGADALAITIPPPLLAALGISYASGAAAPAILAMRAATTEPATQGQLDAAADRQGVKADVLAARGQVVGNQDAVRASWLDLFTGEDVAVAGRVDLSKVQQALLTFVLTVAYIGSALAMFRGLTPITSLPSLGDGTAELLGISHLGYLVYKAVPKPDSAQAAPARVG